MAITPTLEACMEKLQEITEILAQMNTDRFAEQYLDNEEFCALLKISGKTAQVWRQSGEIPFAQLGRKIYYRLADIEALFEKEFSKPKHLPKRKSINRRGPKRKPGSNGWELKL